MDSKKLYSNLMGQTVPSLECMFFNRKQVFFCQYMWMPSKNGWKETDHVFPLEHLTNHRGGKRPTQKQLLCVERYCELAYKKVEQLYKVSSPLFGSSPIQKKGTVWISRRIVRNLLTNRLKAPPCGPSLFPSFLNHLSPPSFFIFLLPVFWISTMRMYLSKSKAWRQVEGFRECHVVSMGAIFLSLFLVCCSFFCTRSSQFFFVCFHFSIQVAVGGVFQSCFLWLRVLPILRSLVSMHVALLFWFCGFRCHLNVFLARAVFTCLMCFFHSLFFFSILFVCHSLCGDILLSALVVLLCVPPFPLDVLSHPWLFYPILFHRMCFLEWWSFARHRSLASPRLFFPVTISTLWPTLSSVVPITPRHLIAHSPCCWTRPLLSLSMTSMFFHWKVFHVCGFSPRTVLSSTRRSSRASLQRLGFHKHLHCSMRNCVSFVDFRQLREVSAMIVPGHKVVIMEQPCCAH